MGRRGFVVRAITAVQTLIGATLAFVAGATTLAPSFERRQSSWLRAAHVDAVPDNQPLAVTLRIARQDGFTQVVDRTVVYLVRSGGEIRALSSTCTHLGCRTSYDRRTRRILCPCHGGVYDVQPRLDRGVGERCGPSPSDYVVARQHIRIPGRIGLHFLAARKDAGRMRTKDQCVAFRLHL